MSDRSGLQFVLDTNVFIQANRSYYPLDIHPAFWKCLEHYHQKSRIRSIDWVKKEILKGSGNGLKDWIRKIPTSFFASTMKKEVVAEFMPMAKWVMNHKNFKQEAKSEFAYCIFEVSLPDMAKT